jgi:outer membrane protein assembly factor BamB
LTARHSMPLAAVMLTLLVVVPAPHAQDAPLWRETVSAKVESYDYSAFGSLLVQLKTGLLALDPETGKHLWSRLDVSDYGVLSGTSFGVAETTAGRTVVDLESGQDRWKLSSLGFSSVKDIVLLASRDLMLVFGETTENRHVLVAARYESGEVVWKQPGLYSAPALASKAQKIKYRRWLSDTEHTVVLDPTDDGLIRLDLRSGQLLWRIAKTELDGEQDFSALFAADGRIYATYGKQLLAIDAEKGKVLWIRKEKFPTPVFQMASTSQGLLLRGAYNLDGNGRASWHPYLALLDPATGAMKWTTEKSEFQARSSFLLEDNAIVIALEKGIATYDLASGRVLTSVTMPEFAGGEDPCCLQRFEGGRLLVWSSQNLRMFDQSGKSLYSIYLKPPGSSFLAKVASTALAVAAGAASYAAASPGGRYYAPTVNPVLTARYKATVNAERFSHIFTEAADSDAKPTRFSLVRIDKETGKETGRLWFTDRSPSFRLDPATGVAVVFEDNAFFAMRFTPVS